MLEIILFCIFFGFFIFNLAKQSQKRNELIRETIELGSIYE